MLCSFKATFRKTQIGSTSYNVQAYRGYKLKMSTIDIVLIYVPVFSMHYVVKTTERDTAFSCQFALGGGGGLTLSRLATEQLIRKS